MDIHILGIETSCDETAASVVKNGRTVLSNVISSQAKLHGKYGGIVPEVASRRHVENIIPVIDQALNEAAISLGCLDAVGVTYGPGLVGALLTGVTAAKAISFAAGKPLIGIHHIEGHICANYFENAELEPPFICLVVSGGHSHIIHVIGYGRYAILGQTRDDAAGEAFDKAARVLGLGYPGGPAIDRAAKEGDSSRLAFPETHFHDGSLDFSFSGIKTALLNYLNRQCKDAGRQRSDHGSAGSFGSVSVNDIAASYQKAIVAVLIENTLKAVKQMGLDTVCMAGGVASNSELRERLKAGAREMGIRALMPRPGFCTDNAAMVASAAHYRFIAGRTENLALNAVPNLKLDDESYRI